MVLVSAFAPERSRPATLACVESEEFEALLDRAGEEPDAIGPALEVFRGRLERMLRMRMDPRVAARTGVSDVMQDAYLEVARRLPQYLDERREWKDGARTRDGRGDGPMPFFVWVRFIATQALNQTHRTHLGTIARDAGRDVRIDGGHGVDGAASSMMFASALLQTGPSPSGAAAIEERREILSAALEELSDSDREILFLRHFEQLGMREVAAVLGLTSSGVRVRHLKALQRLQHALGRCGLSFDPLGSSRASGDGQ